MLKDVIVVLLPNMPPNGKNKKLTMDLDSAVAFRDALTNAIDNPGPSSCGRNSFTLIDLGALPPFDEPEFQDRHTFYVNKIAPLHEAEAGV